MSKKNTRKVYRLERVIPAYEEALGTEGGVVEFEGDADGKTYTMPHPMLSDDAFLGELEDAASTTEMVQVLLGDQYDAFVEGGNSVKAVSMLFALVGRDARESVQKVRITRS